MRKLFVLSIVCGAILLLLTPMMREFDVSVTRKRPDSETARCMRGDIVNMFCFGGMPLIFGGCAGLVALRRVSGSWAQKYRSISVALIYLMATPWFGKSVFALPFIVDIFDPMAPNAENEPITIELYTIGSNTLALIVMITALFSLYRARKRYPSKQFACEHCGYNLFTNVSGICPECGTPIPDETKEKLAAEPPSSNAKIDTHRSPAVDK